MTKRKPPDVPVGNWVDQLIREAQERGEFDDLPGTGKPLRDIDQTDEDWWIRRKLRDEKLPADALLPPALVLRKEVADLPGAVSHLRTEEAVRAHVREVNRRVAEWIRLPTGPVVPVAPADVEEVVAGWREARPGTGGAPVTGGTSSGGGSSPSSGETRRRWWRRRSRQVD
ncbi:MAG: DUF1992 domain-containing protein [Actinomycetaceae bacterium]